MIGGLLSLLMISCSEAYPGIYDDSKEDSGGVNNDEVTSDKVPIMLSFTDPWYSIETRGSGAFENWDETNPAFDDIRKKWLSADFYIYAFLAKNDICQEVPMYDVIRNYKDGEEDGTYCLLNNARAQIKPNLQLELKSLKFYNQKHQDYKYNFFIYHIEDAYIMNKEISRDKVSLQVQIDGTQDVISGVARPSKEQIKKMEGDDYKYIFSNWGNLIYSTMSGHRGFNPIFNVKHALCRVNFSIVGKTENSNRITLKDVKVYAPYQGRFTVAADDTTTVGSIVWTNDVRYIHVPEGKTKEFGVTLGEEALLDPDKYNVEENKTIQIGSSLLLPPLDRYKIEIVVSERLLEDKEKEYTIVYNSVGPKEGFQSGKRYDIQLWVYGSQEIKLGMNLEGSGWVEDDTPVVADPEEGFK